MAVVEPDWLDDHPEYHVPQEWSDRHSRDEIVKTANEATAHAQQSAWSVRQRDFFKWLAAKEKVWFG